MNSFQEPLANDSVEIKEFLTEISQGQAQGDKFCLELMERTKNCNQLLSWQKSNIFGKTDINEDIDRVEQPAIQGIAFHLSQKYLRQVLDQELKTLQSKYSINPGEDLKLEEINTKLNEINLNFQNTNLFETQFQSKDYYDLLSKIRLYPKECIESTSLNEWRDIESLALHSFSLNDRDVTRLVMSETTETNEIQLFKAVLEHPNEAIKRKLLPDFQKAQNVLFFKDLLNEYERLESAKKERMVKWSRFDDIKAEQTEIYHKINLNKNLLKFYNHVDWHLNDQNQVKKLRVKTETELKEDVENDVKNHEKELVGVKAKAKILWKHLLTGQNSIES